ncbi:MAG: DedA family protein [Vicinamibacterales bacterium]
MDFVFDLFLNLDEYLATVVASYGVWVYALLFAIIFAETGLVITPILPGDSLLFACGALAAGGAMDLWILLPLLFSAAVIGDAVNYSAGRFFGPKIFQAHDRRGFWHKVLNRNHLNQAHAFFEKYGGMAIVSGRFVPIVRTFVPFVAGAGYMTYTVFSVYNVAGAAIWVGVCVMAGYLFGEIPIVKENFELVVLGIIAVSLLPMAAAAFQRAREKRAARHTRGTR